MKLTHAHQNQTTEGKESILTCPQNIKISDLFTESEKEDSEDQDDAAGEQTSSLPVQCKFSGDNEPFYLKESGVKGAPLYDTNTYNELEHIVSLTLVPCFDEVSTTTAETAD